MDLLAYWRWDNYVRDLDEGAGFNFNSNQSRLHSAIELGETLWLVTGHRQPGGMRYPLVARLVIRAKTHNPPGYKYRKFRVWGNIESSEYYYAGGPDSSDLLLNLEFHPRKMISARERIGQALQTMRSLSSNDTRLLSQWTENLSPEPRAQEIADEPELERSFDTNENDLQRALTYHKGVSSQRKRHIRESYGRNRKLVDQLHDWYKGRCQLCGFDPKLLYGVRACSGHHVVYLSRGGHDKLENMLLLCPNHHQAIHATNAVFDFRDLHYVFPNGRREPLALNRHLSGLEAGLPKLPN